MTKTRDRTKDRLTKTRIESNSLSIGSKPHPDGGGLFIIKTAKDRGRWVLRFSFQNKPKQMGLGSYPAVSLDEARELRDTWKAVAKSGRDPVFVRKQEAANAARADQRASITLREVAEQAFEKKRINLKGERNAKRWWSVLNKHVLNEIGHLQISQVDQIAVHGALKGIWQTKHDTARKSLERLAYVLRHAKALGLAVNPDAISSGKELLGVQEYVAESVPHIPWREMPSFYNSLREDLSGHLMLKLLILNPGPRSTPLRHLRVTDIDFEERIWTVPGFLMKGKNQPDFRQPLCDESIRLIHLAHDQYGYKGWVFPAQTRNAHEFLDTHTLEQVWAAGRGVVSDMTMTKIFRKRGLDAKPHGTRHSFRTFCSETRRDFRISELSIAHKVDSKVAATYNQSDELQWRRELMEDWSSFVQGRAGADVIQLDQAKAQ